MAVIALVPVDEGDWVKIINGPSIGRILYCEKLVRTLVKRQTCE